MSEPNDNTLYSKAKHLTIKYGAPVLGLFVLSMTQACSVKYNTVNPVTNERGPEQTLFEVPTPKVSPLLNKATNAIHESRQDGQATYGEQLPSAEYANKVDDPRFPTTVYPPTAFDPNLRLHVVDTRSSILMGRNEKPVDWLIKYNTESKQAQIITTMLFGDRYYEIDATFSLVGNSTIELGSVNAKNLEGPDAGYQSGAMSEILAQQQMGLKRGIKNDLSELVHRINVGMSQMKKWERQKKSGANYGAMQTVVSPEPGAYRTGWQGVTHESQIHVKQGYGADDITIDTTYHIKNIPNGRAKRLELRAGPAREPGGEFSKFVNDSMAKAGQSNDNPFRELSFHEREPIFETEMALMLLDLDIRSTPDEAKAPHRTGVFRYDGYPIVDTQGYFKRIANELSLPDRNGNIVPVEDIRTLTREQLGMALEIRLADQYAKYAPGWFRKAGVSSPAVPSSNIQSRMDPRAAVKANQLNKGPSQMEMLKGGASGKYDIDIYTPGSSRGSNTRGYTP